MTSESLQKEIKATEATIKAYAAVMADTDGISFYDVSRLPQPKDDIAKALLLAIKLTGDNDQRESLKVALNILARFQEDIGPGQVRPSPVLPDGGNTSPQEVARLFAAHQDESEKFSKLQARAQAEEQAYADVVEQLLKL